MENDILKLGKRDNIRVQLDRLRQEAKSNVFYWKGRDVMQILGYSRWENFQNVIEKAMAACELSGHIVSQQFRETTKPVQGGSGSTQNIQDYFLTRYACFLIAMSGDTTKVEVSEAQTYFAVQTRKQEAGYVLHSGNYYGSSLPKWGGPPGRRQCASHTKRCQTVSA